MTIVVNIKAKNHVKRITTHSGSERDREAYHKLNNDLKVTIHAAKVNYLKDAVCLIQT